MSKLVNWRRINEHGPYVMGVWSDGKGSSVGNEESNDGRAEVICRTLRADLLRMFSLEQLSKMSVVDIGCHDGWLLHQLSDLPFQQMVGIEPRKKNVLKGHIVREELGLTNRVDYRVGEVGDLQGRKYDVVIVSGVLYHVPNIQAFLSQIKDLVSNYLFIESRVLRSELLSLELKLRTGANDGLYKLNAGKIGLTTHKYESSHSDGSTVTNSIVSIPSCELLEMYLSDLGFKDIRIVLGPKAFRRQLRRKDNPVDGACFACTISLDFLGPDQAHLANGMLEAHDHVERVFLNCTLPDEVIKLVTGCLQLPRSAATLSQSEVLDWLDLMVKDHEAIVESLIRSLRLTSDQALLFRDIKFAPRDKLDFERAKLLLTEGQVDDAQLMLECLVQRPNADWRSTYRSFALLAVIAKRKGDEMMERDAIGSLTICNERYPLELLKIDQASHN